mmetsp:Transcript_103307/g.179226  ORF Transcript_103307/g.179226 Transcript_103307/m.179226 type:complete len:355 (+) Transcript_103307:47-1111(+)
MASDSVTGLVGLMAVIIFWGSMNIAARAAESCFSKASVLIFFSAGICISSLGCVGALMTSMTPGEIIAAPAFLSGAIGGALWTPSQMMLLTAIMDGGLSLCQGACSGTAIVGSNLLGILVQHETVKTISAEIAGLVALVVGVAGLIGAKHQSSHAPNPEKSEVRSFVVPLCKSLLAGILVSSGGLMADKAVSAPTIESPFLRACAFQTAFGCSQFILHLVIVGSYLLYQASVNGVDEYGMSIKQKLLEKHVTPLLEGVEVQTGNMHGGSKNSILVLSVMCGGVMFTCGYLGNSLSIAHFGLSVAFPSSQLSLVLSSAWGIVLFNEVEGSRRIAAMLVSAIVMVLGATLLTMSKA